MKGLRLAERYLVGLDFGTASARGVLVDLTSGRQVRHAVSEYARGVLSDRLSDSVPLAPGFALHHPADYVDVAVRILSALGRDRDIVGIGIASTASSPLPTDAEGSPLVGSFPDDPHAYVKLWKHARAQPFAERIISEGKIPSQVSEGRLSGESLLAKAAETEAASPVIWRRADKFLEVGDWLAWQMTGNELRSMDFACFKALYTKEHGYPAAVVRGLAQKLSEPVAVGEAAGYLSREWIEKTGIKGGPIVSVACIDSHAVLPAVGVTSGSTLVGVLGTSSGFLALDSRPRSLPVGYERAAFGAALPDRWCCEAGQAAFGDVLNWFLQTFPQGEEAGGFAWYDRQADVLAPGQSGLLALDWFGGSRVPYADASLGGLLMGFRVGTTAVAIYRALIESLAFGVRAIVERGRSSGLEIDRVLLTSAVARSNAFLVQTICDVLGRPVEVPDIDHVTAMGAAIHAAVAASVVSGFDEGARRFGCFQRRLYEPNVSHGAIYDELYGSYAALSRNEAVLTAMRRVIAAANTGPNPREADDI